MSDGRSPRPSWRGSNRSGAGVRATSRFRGRSCPVGPFAPVPRAWSRLEEMRSVEVVMRNPSGLHARPATLFTEAAAGFAAKVTVENLTRGNGPVDAKSMLMLLTAGVSKDHRIRLVADGADEDAAIDALVALVESGLGEPSTA
ncbi:MAG: HPr family phosphocarrier protein [Chloroflexi bacterium]|nr:HPr family phosphocarrier protein [Chloroflexota bacterium]